MSNRALAINQTYAATVAELYQLWISTDTVLAPTEALEINPEVGGLYRLIMPGNFCMTGYFSVVRQNQQLTYSWQWQDDDEVTLVDVQFCPTESGDHCLVKLIHRGFDSDESLQRHDEGWHNYLSGLNRFLKRPAKS